MTKIPYNGKYRMIHTASPKDFRHDHGQNERCCKVLHSDTFLLPCPMTSIVFISSLLAICFGLECYTGYSVMHGTKILKQAPSFHLGSTIGEETKQCGKPTDSCYNATIHVGSYAKLQKAGCNTVLCQVKVYTRN